MFVAKKVATVSTDIRKTLEICRNAIEQASDEVRSRKVVKVSIDHVKQAYNNVYSQPYHECLPFLSERVKLLLVSIALEAHYKGYNIAYLSNVCERFNQLQSVVLGINVRSNQT
jgi:origin recognition complex subunit 1